MISFGRIWGDPWGLRARVESYVVPAPVLAVTLRVPELVRLDARTLNLFEAAARADTTLPRLTAELAAELGAANVGLPQLCDTWVPEDRTRLVPYPPHRADDPTAAYFGAAPEPARFLAEPRTISGPVPKLTRVAKLTDTEWWCGGARQREFAIAWLDGALAWVEVDRVTDEMWLCGWVG